MMILFGVRSPLVVDYEESLARCGLSITSAISVAGAPRLLDRSRVVELDAFSVTDFRDFLVPAFAPARRRELWDIAVALGLQPGETLVDPSAILPRSLRIGRGSFINAGVVVGAASIFGDGVVVNRAASLGHHTILGDFVSIGPGATLAGNIQVGSGSLIGAGAVILPNTRVGERAIVSAGAVVRKHVADDMLVVGNPAKAHPFNARRSSLTIEEGE